MKKVSKHAKRRMLERTDYNHKERRQLFREALEKGKSIADISNEEIRRYLKGKERYNSKVKLHKGYVYVYSRNAHRLYTMYRLPEEIIGISRN